MIHSCRKVWDALKNAPSARRSVAWVYVQFTPNPDGATGAFCCARTVTDSEKAAIATLYESGLTPAEIVDLLNQ